MDIRKILNQIDHKCLDEDLKFLDLRSLYEASKLTYQDKKEIEKVLKDTDDPETIAAVITAKSKKNESYGSIFKEMLEDEISEDEINILNYPIEYDYRYETDDVIDYFKGHLTVKASNEEEAIEKAKEYLASNEYEYNNPNHYDPHNIVIGTQFYTNVPIIEQTDSERYRIRAYYDDNYRGLSDDFKSNDLDTIKDTAHSYLSNGLCIIINDYETGKLIKMTPDEYFADFEGEGIQSYMFDESLTEATKLDIIKHNKKAFTKLQALITKMPDGIEKDVAKYLGLKWLSGHNWLGGLSDKIASDAIIKLSNKYNMDFNDVDDIFIKNFIDNDKYGLNESLDEKLNKLNNKDKKIYIDIIKKAEDREDLEDIVHEIFFYDKALFAMMNKFPKDASFEELKANKIAILKDSMLDESLNEGWEYTQLIDEEGKTIIDTFLNKTIFEKFPEDLINNKDLITNLYSIYVSDYKKFPNPNTIDSLDQKYSMDHGRFYEKWRPVIDKCKEIVKKANVSGYGRWDFFTIKIRDIVKAMEYNFPYGWKNEVHEEDINEDTIKQGNKWVNKGDTGETHGEFKTKKEADAQRKAMFASGWKGK